MNETDLRLMRRCFDLANEAERRGDTPVGSLITDENGKIIAEATERNRTFDKFAHAEILAVKEASEIRENSDLSDCTLYTTNEPCFLCSYAIRQTVIARVVYSKMTPNIGGVTSKYPILTAEDISNWEKAPKIIQITNL